MTEPDQPAVAPDVRCVHVRMVPTSELVPNERNPNQHPEEQLRLLAKNIVAFGWRHPITVSNLSGKIVSGHARWEVAKRLGFDVVPVDFQDFDSVESERAVLLSDNRLAELAEMQLPILKDLLLEMDTGVFDMELVGYTNLVLESLMTAAAPSVFPDAEALANNTDFKCPSCGYEWSGAQKPAGNESPS